MPLSLTVSCFSKIQIGFTFLVPAHLGSPGKRVIKRMCVCVLSHKAIPIFPYNTVWDRWNKASTKKTQLHWSSRFNTTPACDRRTERQSAHLWWLAVAKPQAASMPIAWATAPWDRQTDGSHYFKMLKKFKMFSYSPDTHARTSDEMHHVDH